MRKLRSDTELMLSLLYWQTDPRGNAERVKAAAENYLTDPAFPDPVRKARPYTERLAHAALKCAAATPDQVPLAQRALAEIVAAATKEQKEERDAAAAAQLADEKRQAIARGELPADPPTVRTRWDERADLA